ncbi:MAG TPA: hypothetical protein VI643_06165, partial [Planctomycetota bacterium]|nr:hypothetical protein [Planctomycetota bacterium]
MTITPDMRVDETLRRFPRTRAVFNRHGLGGCGGVSGPPETIEFFAKLHGGNLETFLQELNESLSQEALPGRIVEVPDTLYRLFVRTAVVMFLTGGATAGTVLLGYKTAYALEWLPKMEGWAAHVQAHGHVQIFGWVALFILGISYHVVPRFLGTELRRRELAVASFWLMLGGILLTAYFQPLAQHAWAAHWLVIAAGLEFVAALFFLLAIRATARRSGAAPAVHTAYLMAGTSWFLIGTLATFALAIERLTSGRSFIPPAADEAYLHILLVGFVSMFILGVSLRTLPVFLGLRVPSDGASKVALLLLNLGVAAAALGHLWERPVVVAFAVGGETL